MITISKKEGEEITYELNEVVDTTTIDERLNDVYAMYNTQLELSEAFELFDGNTIQIEIPSYQMQAKDIEIGEDGFLEGHFYCYFNADGKYYKVTHTLSNWKYITLYEWDNADDVDNEKRCNTYCHDRDRKGNMMEVYRYKYISDTEKDYELLYSVYQNVY